MSSWFLKNIKGSDLAKLLDRKYKIKTCDLNMCLQKTQDEEYVLFSAICENTQETFSLLGRVFNNRIECCYQNILLGKSSFDALKYGVYKRLNSQIMNHYKNYKTLDDYYKFSNHPQQYAKFLHDKRCSQPVKTIQKTL